MVAPVLEKSYAKRAANSTVAPSSTWTPTGTARNFQVVSIYPDLVKDGQR